MAAAHESPRLPDPTPRRGEEVLRHLDCVSRAVLAADEAGQDELRDDLGDMRDALAAELVELKAETVASAAAQICVAFYYAELMAGCPLQVDRDAYHDRLKALLRSALRVVGKDVSEAVWHSFVGGSREAPT